MKTRSRSAAPGWKSTLIAAAAVVATAGCGIPYASEDPRKANVCSSDSDCPEGSSCAPVGETSTCVAGSSDLSTVVFEIRPAPGARSQSGPSLVEVNSLRGGAVVDLDLVLPAKVDVSPGQVFLPCAGDTPVPAKVMFQPVSGLAGLLEGQSYQADSVVDADGKEGIAVRVPEGNYNLYIQPSPDPAVFPECVTAPPIFMPGWTIENAKGIVAKATEPLLLKGTLKLSEKEDFTKWFVEVVEPVRGQTISEIVQPEQSGIALEVPFQVWFDWTARKKFMPVIRLRPPQGSGKPVIHWSLDAVALQGLVGNEIPVKLDVSGINTQPRPTSGQVLFNSQPVAATVTLRSISISKVELARYETVVQTDENGFFNAALPPGIYQVIARPHKEGLALGLTTWEVAAGTECFCGNSVQVPAATTLAGSVYTPSGDGADVEVRLTPAATGPLPYLGTVSTTEVLPRPTSVFAQGGQFQMSVDPGLFDLSIVAPRDSGYPWLVRPNQPVASSPAGGAPAVVSLEPFELANPVLLRGRLVDPGGGTLAGATIRAWTAVGDASTGKLPTTAVQIGETIADESGGYVILLPPSVR